MIFVIFTFLSHTPRTVLGTGQALQYELNEWLESPKMVSSRPPVGKLKTLDLQLRGLAEPWQ